jgi:hypothetical protein
MKYFRHTSPEKNAACEVKAAIKRLHLKTGH